jgi:peptidoglycan/LPS O-acetylase OafA/YrhL
VRQTNRYDLLRFVFAAIVFGCHVIVLPGFGISPEMEYFFLETLGRVAIQGFFVISGALVLGSLERSSSVASYAAKRTRRLYPAYFVIVMTCAIAALILVPAAREDLATTAKYIGFNLVFLNFLQPDLPGVFEGQRFTAVNGALWTVKIEVMFYMVLPILVWILNRLGKFRFVLLGLIYIASEIWRIGLEHYGMTNGSGIIVQLSRQLPGQMSFFVAGMLLWEFRDIARKRWAIVAFIGVVGLAASYLPALEPIRALTLACLIAAIALSPGPELNAARFGDFSYGMYGAHFPVTQTVIALGLFQTSMALGYVVSAIATMIAAILLWNFVEKPFLHKGNWYLRKSKEDEQAAS